MANAPQGPRECGAPTEDEHHELPHGEEGDHTAQEVGAPRALCHVGGEVPLGFGHRGPRAADNVPGSIQALPVRQHDVGLISSHIRYWERLSQGQL